MADHDMLRRENKILKEENKLLRTEVLKRATRVENRELLQLIDLQRQRIDNLEREYDILLASKPQPVAVTSEPPTSSMELQEKVEQLTVRN